MIKQRGIRCTASITTTPLMKSGSHKKQSGQYISKTSLFFWPEKGNCANVYRR